MAVACVNDFIEALSQSQILEPEQHRELPGLQVRFQEPRPLATELVRRGWLTAFQAQMLLQARGSHLLLGQYVLLDRLGEGGMGQVFKARQKNLRRIVAVKVIKRDCLTNPRAVPRFQREIRAAAQLAHPNIVHAYDADEINGVHFFVMEYIDGVDLFQLVKETGPLEVAQACTYVRQAALGLQHAHERGMVHRDIKPANLLVTHPDLSRISSGKIKRPAAKDPKRTSGAAKRPDVGHGRWGIVKILDLGLARQDGAGDSSTQMTLQGAIMGTPDFIAPEQALNSSTSDIRADIYSLGCTFYFMLAGGIPFPNGSLTEKLMQHQFAEPEPVEQARKTKLHSLGASNGSATVKPEIPSSVCNLVRWMMAKKPEDRPQTPAEVAAAIEELAKSGKKGSLRIPTPKPKTMPDTDAIVAAVSAIDADATAADTAAFPIVEILRPRPASRKQNKRWKRAWLVGAGILVLLLVILAAAGPRSETKPTPPDAAEGRMEAAWKLLQAESRLARSDPDTWRQMLLSFRMRFPGSPQAERATKALIDMPSPLDALDPKAVNKNQWFAWMPAEVVAVLGDRFEKFRRSAICLAFSPDGRYLAAGNEDNTVRLWSLADREAKQPPPPARLAEHTTRVSATAFSPDGRSFASGSGDGTVVIWETAKAKAIHRLQAHQDTVSALAFSPDGKTLASAGGDGRVVLWDPASGKERHAALKEAVRFACLAFSPDGRNLVAGGTGQTLVCWNMSEDALVLSGTHPAKFGWVKALAFSPDGKHLVYAGGGDGTISLCAWTAQGPKPLQTLKGHAKVVRELAFSGEGKSLLSTGMDNSVKHWDVTTGNLLREWSDLRHGLNAIAFAPDGRHFALSTFTSSVWILRLQRRNDAVAANGPEFAEGTTGKGGLTCLSLLSPLGEGR